MKFSPQAQILLYRSIIITCVLTVAGLTHLHFLTSPIWGFNYSADTTTIHDFSIIFNYAKDFWKGNNLIPYTESGIMAFMERWTGQPQTHSMPFAYSPTMLIVLLPFAWFHVIWAYLLWILTPLIILLLKAKKDRELILLSTGIITGTAFSSIALGQTVMWTLLAYVTVLIWLLKNQEKQSFSKLFTISLIVFLLTAKPPVAITIFALLFFARKWKVLAIALTLVTVEIILFTCYLGTTWITDYIHLVTHYSRDIAPKSFAMNLNPQTMSNLSLVLHSWLGLSWSKSGMLSNTFWLFGTGLSLVWGITHYRLITEKNIKTMFCLLFSFYLLGVSHLTATEDLLILIPLWLVRDMNKTKWFSLLALSWIGLNMGNNKFFFQTDSGTILVFFIKIIIIVSCLAYLIKKSSTKPFINNSVC